MKRILIILIILVTSNSAFSDPPVISHNVHVMQNATSAQCSGSFRSDADPDPMVDETRFGQGTVESPGLQSCTGCSVDPVSKDCVCKTCYEFFNN